MARDRLIEPVESNLLLNEACRLMLRQVAVMAGCVDVFFLWLFHVLDMPLLSWVNILSASMYATAFVLLGRRKMLPAVWVMLAEVLVHASATTLMAGWNSGAHYFLLVFLPVAAVCKSVRQCLFVLGGLLVLYLGLNEATQHFEPIYTLSSEGGRAMRWVCITIVFIMFGYAGRYYAEVVTHAEHDLRRMATVDPLSELWNRRHILDMAQKEMAHAQRQGLPLSFVLGDIDHFKVVNDTYGHDAGDRVIQHVAAMFKNRLRCSDVTGRWGGEEILVLLPATDAQGAFNVCENLRAYLEKTPCVHHGQTISITMSFGVCQVMPHQSLEHSIKQADMALYDAKHGGRNRVVTIPALAQPAAVAA